MKRITRQVVAEALDFIGLGCVVGAVSLWNVAVGLGLFGLGLVAVAWVIDR